MSTELVRSSAQFMPVVSIQDAVARRKAIVDFTAACMVEGTDYGTIPGTNDKKVLLKAGAEKLLTLFGLCPRFSIVEKIEDWTGANHAGEPLFYYIYRCSLYRNGELMAEGDGSCNSWEKKYRYRKAERVCPHCGAAAIIKGKAEYGGGYICFAKKGGCGAKFSDGNAAIENQETGMVANTEVADIINTIQKMSVKRSLVSACLLAVNASEFFSQDLVESLEEIGTSLMPHVQTAQTPEPLTEAQVLEGLKTKMSELGITAKLSVFVKELCGFGPNVKLNLSQYEWALNQPDSVWKETIQKMQAVEKEKEKTALRVVTTPTVEPGISEEELDDDEDPFDEGGGVLRDGLGNVVKEEGGMG